MVRPLNRYCPETGIALIHLCGLLFCAQPVEDASAGLDACRQNTVKGLGLIGTLNVTSQKFALQTRDSRLVVKRSE